MAAMSYALRAGARRARERLRPGWRKGLCRESFRGGGGGFVGTARAHARRDGAAEGGGGAGDAPRSLLRAAKAAQMHLLAVAPNVRLPPAGAAARGSGERIAPRERSGERMCARRSAWARARTLRAAHDAHVARTACSRTRRGTWTWRSAGRAACCWRPERTASAPRAETTRPSSQPPRQRRPPPPAARPAATPHRPARAPAPCLCARRRRRRQKRAQPQAHRGWMTLPRRRAPAVVPASPKPFSALGSVASAVSSAIVSAGGRTAAPHEAALLGSHHRTPWPCTRRRRPRAR